MVRTAFLVSVLSVWAFASQAQQGQDIGSVPIDESFIIQDLDTTNMVPVTLALTARPHEGRIAVCAAFQARSTSYMPALKRSFYVTEGTRTILRGLGWADLISPGVPLVGQAAKCRLTTAPAVENPQLGVGVSRTRF